MNGKRLLKSRIRAFEMKVWVLTTCLCWGISGLVAQTTCSDATWLVPGKSYQNDSRTSAGITSGELAKITSSGCNSNATFSLGEKVMWHKVLGTGDQIALSFVNNSSYATFDPFNSFAYAVFTGSCDTGLSCVDIDPVSTGSRFTSVAGETYYIAMRIDNTPMMSSPSPTEAMYDARVLIVPDFEVPDQTIKVSRYASSGEIITHVMENSALVDVDNFTIVSGNDESIFGISGEELSIANETNLQNSLESTFTLVVEAEDTDAPQTTQGTITIEVVDNYAPEEPLGPFGLMVDENSAAYTLIGNVAATDAEGDVLSYEIEDITAPFYIGASTGDIYTKTTLDYESGASYTFNVIVSQESPIALSTTYSVAVDVTDVDETGEIDLQQFVLDITAGSNYTLGSFNVEDPDGYTDILTVMSVSPLEDFVDGDEFEVSGENLNIVAIDDVRDSGAKTYEISVESDFGGVSAGVLKVVVPGAGIPAIAYSNAHEVDEDVTSGYLTGISVYDSDVATGNLTLTLSTTDGLLTSDELTGTSFSVGDGTDDASMTLSGTMTALNNFLAKLKFTPTADFSGTATVDINVEDALTNTASEAFSITVNPVNDPVSVTVPTFVSVNEDSSGGINALNASIVLSDADDDASTIADATGGYYLEIEVSHGEVQLLSAGSLSFFAPYTGRSKEIYALGSINNINSALQNPLVRYLPESDYFGTDFIEVTLTSTANASDVVTTSIPVFVEAVNDVPAVTLGDPLVIDEDSQNAFVDPIAVSDVDNTSLRMSLSCTNGVMTIGNSSGLTYVGGNGFANTSMVVTATISAINSSLETLVFTPTSDFNGSAEITVMVDDNLAGGGSAIDTKVLAVTVNAVNDAPVVTLGDPLVIDEDSQNELVDPIAVSDVDNTSLRMSLSCTNGVMTIGNSSGLTYVEGNGFANTSMVVTATISAINSSLETLVFTPTSDFSGSAEITVLLDDNLSGGGLTASETLSVTVNPVNDAPVVILGDPLTIDEDTYNNSLDAVTISDVDHTDLRVTIAASNGNISIPTAGLSFVSGDGSIDESMTFTGSISAINTSLASIVYNPTANFFGAVTVTITVDDELAGGGLTDADVLDITVTSVNDAPAISIIGGVDFVTIDEDDIAVSDLDISDSEPVFFAVDERAPLSILIEAEDIDHTSNELTFDIDQASKDKGMVISTGGTLIWTPDESISGTYVSVSLYVTDGEFTDDMLLELFVNEVANVWSGTAWSDGVAPAAGESARLDGDFDFLTDGTFEASDLEVSTGVTLTVNNESTLIVSDGLTNNGDIVVASGSSLITYAAGSFTGNDVVINRTTRYADGRYSFVGTPVQQDATITEANLGSYVYRYDESQSYGSNEGLDRWIAISGELVPGEGYTQADQQDISFTGVLNVGTISYLGTYTEDTDDAYEGWALVSNPYAAAIKVADFLTENTNIAGAVYIWDDNGSNTQRGSNADYIVANGTMATNTTAAGGNSRYNQHLGSAQGFFVKLNNGVDTQIDFTEAMRVTGNNTDGSFFRKEPLPIIRVNLTHEDGLFKQTVIAIDDEASKNEINRKYDAPAFNSKVQNGIFTVKADQTLALVGLPSGWEKVDLQVNTSDQDSHTISIEMENYKGPVYLHDSELNITTDLAGSNYSFYSNKVSTATRFQLVSSPSAILSVDEKLRQVYAYERTLYIRSREGVPLAYTLVTLGGQEVMKICAASNTAVDLSGLARGVYVVRGAETSHKILLR